MLHFGAETISGQQNIIQKILNGYGIEADLFNYLGCHVKRPVATIYNVFKFHDQGLYNALISKLGI